MTLSQASIKRITYLMSINGINSPYQLALKSGLDESVVRSVLNGRTKYPSLHTMFCIAIGLNVTLSELYDDVLFDVNNIEDN